MVKKRIKALMPLLQKIEKKFKPEKIILFGSRARSDYLEESDYDLLVIASEFKKTNFHDRAVSIYHLKRNIPASIDIICLTPKEFAKKLKEHGIIREAIKEGIEI